MPALSLSVAVSTLVQRRGPLLAMSKRRQQGRRRGADSERESSSPSPKRSRTIDVVAPMEVEDSTTQEHSDARASEHGDLPASATPTAPGANSAGGTFHNTVLQQASAARCGVLAGRITTGGTEHDVAPSHHTDDRPSTTRVPAQSPSRRGASPLGAVTLRRRQLTTVEREETGGEEVTSDPVQQVPTHKADGRDVAVDESSRYDCPLCWSILARPVTIDCGFSLCEGCVAGLLMRALKEGRQGAVCPVLGPSCPRGRVRTLPSVNVLLHQQLQDELGEAYNERLAEADASEAKNDIATLRKAIAERKHVTSGVRGARRGPGGGRLVVDLLVEGGGGFQAVMHNPLTFLRLYVHYLPPLVLFAGLLHMYKGTKGRVYAGLDQNPLMWDAFTDMGMSWRSLYAIAQCPCMAAHPAESASAAAGLSRAIKDDLITWRPLHSLLHLRLQVLGDLWWVYKWLGMLALSSDVIHILYAYTYIGYSRIRRHRARGATVLSIVLQELAILFATLYTTKSANFGFHTLQTQLLPNIFRCPVVVHLGWFGDLLWAWYGVSGFVYALYRIAKGTEVDDAYRRHIDERVDRIEDAHSLWTSVWGDPRLELLLQKQKTRVIVTIFLYKLLKSGLRALRMI